MSTIELASASPRSRLGIRTWPDRIPPLTLATVGVMLLAALVVAQAAHGFTDPDYWWHFKTGEYIATHHLIPYVDIFRSTAAGRPWVTHEWLSEVGIYLLVQAGGYAVALAVFTLSPVLSVLMLSRLLNKEGVAPVAALAVTALSAVMIAIYCTVRPQVLSWLCFSILIYALYGYRAGRIRHLWGLPLLFVVWANLHLSFLIGLALVALFIATRAGEQLFEKRPIRVGHLLAVLALCVAAACINPDAPALLAYPLSYLPLQSLQTSFAEWRSPDFHSYLFYPLLASILLLLATGLNPRRLNLWALGLGLSVSALALQSVRYIPVFAVAFVPLAGAALAERWAWARAGSESVPDARRSALHWCLLAAVVLLFAIALRPASWSEFQRTPRTGGQLVPVHAVDVVEQQFPSARIFNQYEWGGYLIYRLWPHQQPFVDGREEMFDPGFLKEYLSTFSAQPGWQDTLDRYDVNLVIVRSDSSMAGALQTNPLWRLASDDEVATVYVRQSMFPITSRAEPNQ